MRDGEALRANSTLVSDSIDIIPELPMSATTPVAICFGLQAEIDISAISVERRKMVLPRIFII